jgi:hypothetical protein
MYRDRHVDTGFTLFSTRYCNVIVIRGHACSARVSVQRSIGHQTKQVDNVEGCGPTSELLHAGEGTRHEASCVNMERCEVLDM